MATYEILEERFCMVRRRTCLCVRFRATRSKHRERYCVARMVKVRSLPRRSKFELRPMTHTGGLPRTVRSAKGKLGLIVRICGGCRRACQARRRGVRLFE